LALLPLFTTGCGEKTDGDKKNCKKFDEKDKTKCVECNEGFKIDAGKCKADGGTCAGAAKTDLKLIAKTATVAAHYKKQTASTPGEKCKLVLEDGSLSEENVEDGKEATPAACRESKAGLVTENDQKVKCQTPFIEKWCQKANPLNPTGANQANPQCNTCCPAPITCTNGQTPCPAAAATTDFKLIAKTATVAAHYKNTEDFDPYDGTATPQPTGDKCYLILEDGTQKDDVNLQYYHKKTLSDAECVANSIHGLTKATVEELDCQQPFIGKVCKKPDTCVIALDDTVVTRGQNYVEVKNGAEVTDAQCQQMDTTAATNHDVATKRSAGVDGDASYIKVDCKKPETLNFETHCKAAIPKTCKLTHEDGTPFVAGTLHDHDDTMTDDFCKESYDNNRAVISATTKIDCANPKASKYCKVTKCTIKPPHGATGAATTKNVGVALDDAACRLLDTRTGTRAAAIAGNQVACSLKVPEADFLDLCTPGS